jgi:nucleoside-diphosphate-sugar epimerase
MRKSILLTGATGFVGKQVLKRLLQSDVDITLVTRTGSNYPMERFENVVKTIETDDLFNETSAWWAASCCDIDVVIHAAWYAEPGAYYTSFSNIDCLRGSLNLAEGCVVAGVAKFVGIGSCAEYEISSDPINHDGVLKSCTMYDAAKIATFQLLEQIFNSKNISFAWCRLFYLYGEGEDKRRLVPYIRSQLSLGEFANLSSGYQVRDFINVTAAGSIIADVALSEQAGAVNVCSGEPKTLREHAVEIAKEYGREDLLNFGGRKDNPLEPSCVVGIPNYGDRE